MVNQKGVVMLHKIAYHPHLEKLFKISAVSHFICLIIDLVFAQQISHYHFLEEALEGFLFATLIAITGVITIRGVNLFIKEHLTLHGRHKIIKESIVVVVTAVLMLLVFLDEELEEKIIDFFNHLSEKTSITTFWIITSVMILLMIQGIIKILSLSKEPLSDDKIKEHLKHHASHFLYKIIGAVIIIGISSHSLGLKTLSSHIFSYTKTITQGFVVVTTIIIIGLWIFHSRDYLRKLYAQKK